MEKKKNKDQYLRHLARVHSMHTAPENLIQEVVREATGKEMIGKDRVIAGEVNEVHEVTLRNNTKVVVRIARRESPHFGHEEWAIKKCKKVGVPVPKILLVKHIQNDSELLSFSVSKKIEGETLSSLLDYKNPKNEKLKSYVVMAGEILSKIHSIKTQGFGKIDQNGKGKFNNFEDIFMKEVNHKEGYLNMAKDVDLESYYIDKALDVLAQGKDVYQKVATSHLTHCDFAPKHIIIKDGKVVGILDFDDVAGHSPLYDFVNWDIWFEDILPTEWLKQGYKNKNLFNTEYSQNLMALIKIYLTLRDTYWYNKTGYREGAERMKLRLISLLESP